MRYNSLQAWLAWQETLHPSEIELGLGRVGTVASRLLPTPLPWAVIAVAGTNGKGSCVAMLDAILRADGYRVGAYTSPHLLHYNERIRIAGECVDDATLCETFARIDDARSNTSLTYFEFATLAALDIFARQQLDVVVLEVGLGGRLDAVNVIDADVALVASIGIDHTEWLGTDRDSIGREKAGIFRAGKPAVCGDPVPPAGLLEAAREAGASLYVAGTDFGVRRETPGWHWWSPGGGRSALPAPALPGDSQYRNAAAVLMVLECMRATLPVSQQAVRTGLQSVRLEGRCQVMPGAVTLLLDVAHNAQAAEELGVALQRLQCRGTVRAVFGVMADKDIGALVRAVAARIDAWYVATPDCVRAADAVALVGTLSAAGCRACSAHASVAAALDAVRDAAQAGDCVVVFGSFYTVSESLQWLDGRQEFPPV